MRQKLHQQLELVAKKGIPIDQIDLGLINKFVGYSNKKCSVTLDKAVAKVYKLDLSTDTK